MKKENLRFVPFLIGRSFFVVYFFVYIENKNLACRHGLLRQYRITGWVRFKQRTYLDKKKICGKGGKPIKVFSIHAEIANAIIFLGAAHLYNSLFLHCIVIYTYEKSLILV